MDNQDYWRHLYGAQQLGQAQGSWLGLENMVGGIIKKIMKRKRHKFLYEVAEKIVSIIEESGVTREEGCELRALVEKIWNMEKEENG